MLKRAEGSEEQSGSADATGKFRFGRVPPGNYEIQVQHEGFKLATLRIKVGSRAPAPVTIVLQLAGIRQQMTVSGELTQVSIDPAENRSAVSVSGQMLESLPVFDQDYIGTMSRFLDQGSVATSGVTLVVDGVEANGPGVSPSAIQDVKINQDPYSTLFSRPGHGRMEITTQPTSLE